MWHGTGGGGWGAGWGGDGWGWSSAGWSGGVGWGWSSAGWSGGAGGGGSDSTGWSGRAAGGGRELPSDRVLAVIVPWLGRDFCPNRTMEPWFELQRAAKKECAAAYVYALCISLL